ncbi:MAG: TolC family protein [Pseudomonadota bacterium]
MAGLRAWLSALLLAALPIHPALAATTSPSYADPQVIPGDDELDQELTLERVLTRSARFYPSILEALQQREQAAGKVTSTEGAFDLLFEADTFGYLGGFYNGRTFTSTVTQPLRAFGGEVYGGWDLSAGELPIYYDEYFTNKGGRLKVGVLFSLMKDRTIDDRRFAIRDARLALQQVELDVLITRIGVQRKAAAAYWYWRALGRQLRAYESLLALSLARDDALQAQVRRGARARIDLTENARNITNRRVLVATARAAFDKAANALALYYRDDNGMMQAPRRAQLPAEMPIAAQAEADQGSRVLAPTIALLPEILARHPSIQRLNVAAQRANAELALARNELEPTLDLTFDLAQSAGGIGQGGVSRDSTDPIVGLKFSVPLQRRKARGEVAAAEAELSSLDAQRRLQTDQLTQQFADLLVELRAAEDLEQLAQLELEQNRTLVRAENARMRQGASDFFLINLREVSAANAEVALLKASLRRQLARIDIDAATLNFESLGLPAPAGTPVSTTGTPADR